MIPKDLFNIFMNDLFDVKLDGNIANYADDKILYVSDKCVTSLQLSFSVT